jgi:hypothetical protein
MYLIQHYTSIIARNEYADTVQNYIQSLTIKIKNFAMLRKIHGTNFFHIKFLIRLDIKCKNGPVLPPAQVLYFNGQALQY